MKKIILTVALLIATPVLARTIINHSDVLGVGSSDHHTLYTHPNTTGDVVTVGDTTATIQADAVTYSKMQNVAADNVFLGNNSGAGGVVDELTGTEATAILNVFTDSLKGLAPLSGGGTTNFLRADGTWAAPGGASPLTTKGDIYTYDTGDQRLGVGTDGQVLTADSAEATGLKWADAAAGGGSSAPIGSIMAYGSSTPPADWLTADGSAVSRTTYSDLFAVISTNYGEGDGSTTFNLPDLRGKFVRGHDDGAGNDPNAGTRVICNTGGATGDNVGSCQADEFDSHNHGIAGHSAGTTVTGQAGVRYARVVVNGGTDLNPDNAAITAAGGSETRPTNVYASYIIKVSNSVAAAPTANAYAEIALLGTVGVTTVNLTKSDANKKVAVDIRADCSTTACGTLTLSSASAAVNCEWILRRDGVIIASSRFFSDSTTPASSSLSLKPSLGVIDTVVGGGTIAYALTTQAGSATVCSFSGLKLFAREI